MRGFTIYLLTEGALTTQTQSETFSVQVSRFEVQKRRRNVNKESERQNERLGTGNSWHAPLLAICFVAAQKWFFRISSARHLLAKKNQFLRQNFPTRITHICTHIYLFILQGIPLGSTQGDFIARSLGRLSGRCAAVSPPVRV